MPQSKNPLKHSSLDLPTEAQLERAAKANAAGFDYKTVKPSQVFGPRADSRLAAEIYTTNIVRYKELKAQHAMDLGEVARPLPQFDTDEV